MSCDSGPKRDETAAEDVPALDKREYRLLWLDRQFGRDSAAWP